MFFAGLERLSLIDYPGNLSAVAFTYGCNMRCPYCHNPELVTEKLDTNRIFSEEDVTNFLKTRTDKLDGLVITGGEPTMHKDLPRFISDVKKLRFKVKLDTNGSNVCMVKELIDNQLVDYWAIDVKYSDELYKQGLNGGIQIANISEALKLIMKDGKDYEFRTTITKSLHDENAMHEIGKLVKGAKRYFLQRFNPGKTIDPTFDESEIPDEKTLKHFARIMREYVDEVDIRGI
jgi:pyruvate formate lyase activating enzyme